MNFRNNNISAFSKIRYEASYSHDNTVLLLQFTGAYNPDGEGVFDGLYMHAMLAAHYFIYEPVAIILDLRDLEYTGGQTILKSINFFGVIGRNDDEYRKQVVIIASPANKDAINDALSLLPHPNQEVCGTYDTAVRMAAQLVNRYLSGK